jgi:sulfhydrogenase subunit beta (sulfur reductase)
MRETGFLAKDKVKEFVEALAKKAQVYAPVKEGDAVIFRPYVEGREICLSRPANASPKSVIFPQSETLFRFNHRKNEEGNGESIELTTDLNFPEAVIVGARPCDAKGFLIYDRVYINTDTPDPYYAERRAKTTIVTLACQAPSPGCFCVAVGGSPSSAEGSDVLMTEVDKGYYLEAITDKGRNFIDIPLIEDGAAYNSEARKAQEKVHEQVQNPFGKEAMPAVSMALFNLDEFWQQVADRCISCGACTFLCPTCYCFNITDEQTAGEGERIRSWDACMFHHFTLEASGHNPRPLKQQRFRNRVGHKFVYYPEKYDGVIACCGCGRCIRYCPVSIDISEVVSYLNESRLGTQKKMPGREEARAE